MNDPKSDRKSNQSWSNSLSGKDLFDLSSMTVEEPHLHWSSKNLSLGKATAALSLPNWSAGETNPERKLHKTLRSWTWWITKKLKKRSSALLAEQDADFHLALITTFDTCQIIIDNNKIWSIKIGKDDNLHDPDVLRWFWQSALTLSSNTQHE
jgi:hypothetical protein